MMRGRKPTPIALRLINGNPSGRPLPRADMPAGAELLEPPGYLGELEKSIWKHAIDHAPRGLLRNIDGRLFLIWVNAAAQYENAAKKVEEFGQVIKGTKGIPIQSPYLSIMNRQAELMMKATGELGFSPTSRTRITLAGAGAEKAQNRFANNAARRT
jgi:P27 family predicted phage terminase small subunit